MSYGRVLKTQPQDRFFVVILTQKKKKQKQTNKQNPYTRPPIHRIKQKLKSEMEKPNLKKKTSSFINDTWMTPLPQTRATELIGHHQPDWRFLPREPRQSPRHAT